MGTGNIAFEHAIVILFWGEHDPKFFIVLCFDYLRD